MKDYKLRDLHASHTLECIDSTMGHIHVCFVVLLVSDDPRTSWSFHGLFYMVKLQLHLQHYHKVIGHLSSESDLYCLLIEIIMI